jgi:hypothetical protein
VEAVAVTDLEAFANARLDEDEAAAIAATPGPWLATGEDILSRADDRHWAGACAANASGADGAHIARHDPARALREVEAGRRILDRHQPDGYGCQYCDDGGHGNSGGDGFCADLADLVYRWADHPDFDQGWKP